MFGIKSKVVILSIVVAGAVGWSNKGTPAGYPNCYVDYPEGVGDGHCSSFYPEHNVEVCGWDGGYVHVRSHKLQELNIQSIACKASVSFVCQPSSLTHSHSLTQLLVFPILLQKSRDCDELNSELWRNYPNCKSGVYPPDIGDGFCTDVFYPHYNTK